MYYRGLGFLTVAHLAPSPSPPHSPAVQVVSAFLHMCRRSSLLMGEGGGRSQIMGRRESLVLYNFSVCHLLQRCLLMVVTFQRHLVPNFVLKLVSTRTVLR
jgi:hypothetical protein